MGRPLLSAILALLLGLWAAPGPALAQPSTSPLEQRLAQWPAWSLPAPLHRPGREDLTYPSWFAGDWQVSDSDGSSYPVRFRSDANGAVVGDRAYNARSVGQARLGATLLRVANDPANPNRQIAELSGGLQLESTVIGRRREQPGTAIFLADELALQVLHQPGTPRLSQVETLSRYALQADGSIVADQWQARFAAPGAGEPPRREPLGSDRFRLRLQPRAAAAAPAAGPAS